jgi:DNA-binding LytR/AlgR family response regulator
MVQFLKKGSPENQPFPTGVTMPETKAIIADADESAIRSLESLLSEVWPDLIICGRAQNGRQALEVIGRYQPQVAFLDVRLPGICGMQVARKVAGVCLVIFITSYEHYAVNAFESGATDYLVRPVERSRLEKAINRAKRQLAISLSPPWYFGRRAREIDSFPAELAGSHNPAGYNFPQLVEQLLSTLAPKPPDYLQWVRVQHQGAVLLIPVAEVCYFKAGDKYTAVVTKKGESLIKKPIKDLAEELDPNRYWRIDRGTIVNVSQIDKVSRSATGRGTVKLKERPELLHVSRSYLHLFKQM